MDTKLWGKWFSLNEIMVRKVVVSLVLGMCLVFTAKARQEVATIQKAPLVHLDTKEISVHQMVDQVERQTEYRFSFDWNQIDTKLIFRVGSKKQSIKNLLSKMTAETGLNYQVVNKSIHLKEEQKTKPKKHPKARQEKVQGTVTDAQSGETLPGVNILVKGTSTGTSTDQNGSFELTVPSLQDTLIFTYIGYQRQVVPINERPEINIEMRPQAITGEKMVVVGYGTQQEKDVTGSVSSVPMGDVETQPLASPNQSMKGQIAGVEVIQSQGIPGGGPKIRVRGTGSLSAGTSPLYVVDGFALPTSGGETNDPLSNIPPESIESISVLKDASATAIYGSRGSNGVVLIETKDGRAGELQVQVHTYSGFQQVRSQSLPDLLNAREFAQFRKEHLKGQVRYEEGREPTPEDIPDVYENPDQLDEGTDWMNAITRNAPMHNINISLSGGNEKLSTYVTGGYLKQEGVVLGSDYERYFLRAKVDATLSDRLNLGFRIAPTYSNRRLVGAAGNRRYQLGYGSALVASPLDPVYNEDGSYHQPIGSPGTFTYPNPVRALKELGNSTTSLRAIGGFYLEFEPVEQLVVRSDLNADWSDDRFSAFHPSTIGNENQVAPVIPTSSYNRGGYLNWQSESTINYSGTIGQNHSFDILAGFSTQQNLNNSANLNGEDYPDDDIQTLNAAARITGSTALSEWSLLSYFGRLNYDYEDTYLLTAALRRDGSSRFGSENQWGLFPSIALGWRISNEPFMENSFFDDLKIRGSYGVNGNYNIGNYAYTGSVGISNYVFDGSLANGKTLNSLRNSRLGWETTSEYNIGIDATFLDSRITAGIDVYQRTTTDMLFDVEIPLASGFSNSLQNLGKIKNRGIEFTLSSWNINTSNFSWNTDFNISSSDNEVVELGPEGDPLIVGCVNTCAPTNITKEGEPVGMLYGWQLEGIYSSEEEINNDQSSYPGAIPGNVKVRDVNGDGNLIKDDDFMILGNPYPDFRFGLTNSFSYKNFNLRLLLTGSYGGKLMRTTNESLWNIDGVFNVEKDYYDKRWISPEQPGDGHTPSPVGPSESRIKYRDPNNLWIHDSSHLWVRNITLGYNLPSNLAGINLDRGRIYISVQNAYLFSKYDGNPEATSYLSNSNLTPGIDNSTYPIPRTYTIGLQFTL